MVASQRRAEVAQRQCVEVHAQPVADRTEEQRAGEHRALGEVLPDRQRHGNVHAARDAGLDPHDRPRVAHGERLREVVVEPPRRTRPRDQEDPHPVDGRAARSGTEEQRAAEDHQRAEPRLPGQVLAEDRHPDDDGERTLEVQEQRPGDTRDPLQAEQQQHRSDDSSGDDHRGQSRDVGTAQTSLGTAARPHDAQRDERADVEQAGEHLWRHVIEQPLRQRRAHTEATPRPRGRAARHDDSGRTGSPPDGTGGR